MLHCNTLIWILCVSGFWNIRENRRITCLNIIQFSESFLNNLYHVRQNQKIGKPKKKKKKLKESQPQNNTNSSKSRTETGFTKSFTASRLCQFKRHYRVIEAKSISLTQLHEHALSWLDTGTSIKQSALI